MLKFENYKTYKTYLQLSAVSKYLTCIDTSKCKGIFNRDLSHVIKSCRYRYSYGYGMDTGTST